MPSEREREQTKETKVSENPPISTGQPSTLGTYIGIAKVAFPKAVPMLQSRIDKFGEDEQVLQDERQMLYLFAQIEFGGAPEHPAVIFCESEGAFSNRWIED